jgi:hypothetical protein
MPGDQVGSFASLLDGKALSVIAGATVGRELFRQGLQLRFCGGTNLYRQVSSLTIHR